MSVYFWWRAREEGASSVGLLPTLFPRWVFGVFGRRDFVFRCHYDALVWDQVDLKCSKPKADSAGSPT